MKRHAFAIAELLVVIAIIAVLAAVVLQAFLFNSPDQTSVVYVVTTPTGTFRAKRCSTLATSAYLTLLDGRKIEVHGTFTVEEITSAEKP